MRFLCDGLCIALALYPLTCVAESCSNGVRANGEAIELSGILHHKVSWGPPNFGENPKTDSRFIVWTISVSKPLVIKGGAQIGGKSQASVSQIQLSIDPTTFNSARLQPLDGKLVAATGKLWNGTSQGDVMPIILAVEAVKPTGQIICRIAPGN